MKKEIQVVMLPIGKAPISIFDFNTSKKNDYSKHLYFTSDEEICKGDWFLNKASTNPKDWYVSQAMDDIVDNPIFQGSKTHIKVIATTDDLHYHKTVIEGAGGVMKDSVPLPEPSQDFIKRFVEEYNKGNVIDKVLVEYEKIMIEGECVGNGYVTETYKYRLKLREDNTIYITEVKSTPLNPVHIMEARKQ